MPTPAREKLMRFRAAYSALLVAAEEMRDELEAAAGTAPEVPADLAAIRETVAQFYGVSAADLAGPRRQTYITFARLMAMALCGELLTHTQRAIAGAFCREHAMVPYSRSAIADWRSLKPANEARYQVLRESCRAAIGK